MALEAVGRAIEVLPAFDDAVETWREVLRHGFHDQVSGLVSTLVMRAAIQRQRGNVAGAISSVDDAIASLRNSESEDLTPLLADMLVQRSQLQEEMGDHSGAVASSAEASDLTSSSEDEDAPRTLAH